MDPKFLINTGQTNTKTAPKNAVDGPGDSATQSGKGFKEAFKAASGAEAKAPVGSQGDTVTEALKPSSGIGEAIKQTGKHLPQKSETGKHYPVNGLQASLPAHKFSGGAIEIEEVVTRSDTSTHLSEGSIGSDHDGLIVMSKGDHAHSVLRNKWSSNSDTSIRGVIEPKETSEASATLSVELLSLGQIKVVLPNGAATRDELVEFAKLQKLPEEFLAQLQDFDGDEAPFISRDDGLRASARSIDLSAGIRGPFFDEALGLGQQLTDDAVSLRADKNRVATNELPPLPVATFDQTSVADSATKLGAGDKSELALSVQKALTSTEFVGSLMQRLEISPEYKAAHATQSEPTYSDVVDLIAQKLSKATRPVASQEAPLVAKTEEALVIRDSIVKTLVSGAMTNLSDSDLKSISNQLAPLFSSVAGDQKLELSDPETDPRPKINEVGSIKLALSSNRWSLHSDGTLGQKSLGLNGDQGPVNPAAVGPKVQILAAEKFDTSFITARPVVGDASRAVPVDELPEPVMVVPSRTEKSLTSSELLDLRNVGTVKSEVTSARVVSSNDLGGHSPSPPEIVSAISSSFTDKPIQSAFDQAAPITTESGVQTQNSSSRSSANDAMRAMQHQPSHQLESDKLNLSARLTQALGERLVQNIRNGNYNIRFNIHPKELGVVDVAMEVRDGRLETQISSPSAVTRDLLSESLPRLRDSLQAGGLQLAGLEVSDNSNDGQQRSLKGSSGNSLNSDDNEDLVETFEVDNLIIDDEAIDYLA